jgi:hypothetical protein
MAKKLEETNVDEDEMFSNIDFRISRLAILSSSKKTRKEKVLQSGGKL